jgi:hypothetical protein
MLEREVIAAYQAELEALEAQAEDTVVETV